jgi:hypothetical protein
MEVLLDIMVSLAAGVLVVAVGLGLVGGTLNLCAGLGRAAGRLVAGAGSTPESDRQGP